MSQLQVRLLGRFDTTLDGKQATGFDSDKVRALLAYLLVESERAHSREKLAGLLWSDFPETSARTSLRRALSNLRKVIGDKDAEPPFLNVTRQTVQFNKQSSAWADVTQFIELRQRIVGGQVSSDQLQEAIGLYSGPFMEGFSLPESEVYEDWLRLSRESFQRQVFNCMERLAELLEDEGQIDQAIRLARAQIEIEPFSESAHRHLMRLLFQTGRRSEALAQYETLKQVLADELQVEPSAESLSLYKQIRRGEHGAPDPALGRKRIRGYELRELIGSGHFGVVYRAQQPVIDRDVAIKIIHPDFSDDPSFIRSFEVEAQLVARLEHPAIVPLYDYWREPGGAYLVMRLLRGGSLRESLERGPWNPAPAAILVNQIASALNLAHGQGVVHRDLKPANILLDNEGNAYLSDFGVASLVGPLSIRDDTIDRASAESASGSLGYISPESIRNEKPTPLTDIYSFGVLLYELLTTEHPFPDSKGQDLLDKHLREPLPLVSDLRPELPEAIDDVIQQATAKDPAERFSDPLILAAAFAQAAEGVGLELQTSSAASEMRNPFKGLRAFGEADSADFFGREALVDRLINRLAADRFLAVVGPSGSGKSSVVKAGLIPALRRGALQGSDDWFIVKMSPGSRPLEELETTLLRIAVNPPDSLSSQMREDERGVLKSIRRALPDNQTQLLLVIDQFEEVFTLLEDEEERTHFLNGILVAATEENSPLRLVVTLRADYYDRPLQYSGFGGLMRQNTEVVLPLSPDELERAILEPASRMGISFDPGLFAEISSEIASQSGSLPLLQYALTELFELRDNSKLSLNAYQEIGGVTGALARKAEEQYLSLDDLGKESARQLFLRLVAFGESGEYTSRKLFRSEIRAIENSQNTPLDSSWDAVIEAFGRARLLTFDRDQASRIPTVELAHEALLKEWDRLDQWLADSRDDLYQHRRLQLMTKEWQEEGRKNGLLLRETRLDQFANWALRTDLVLGGDESAFLEASIAARQRRLDEEKERHQRELDMAQTLAETERQRAEDQTAAAERLRRRAFIMAGALGLAVILAVVAFTFSRQASQNADLAAAREGEAVLEANQRATAESQALDEADARAAQQAIAEENAAQAQSLALAASSRLALNAGDTDLAIALAMEANSLNDPPAQAQLALADAAYEPGTRMLLQGHGAKRIYSLDLNNDASRMLSGAVDRTMILWDMSNGEPIQKYGGFRGSVTSVHYPIDGQEALVGILDGSVRLLNLETGDEIRRYVLNPPVIGAELSPDGRSALWISELGQLALVDLIEGVEVRTFGDTPGELSEEVVTAAAFHPNGQLGISGHSSGQISLWSLNSGEEVVQYEGTLTAIEDLVITADGELVLSADANGSVTAWDLESGELLWRYDPDNIDDKVFRLANWESDGRLVAGALDGGLRTLDRETGAIGQFDIPGHDGWVSAIDVSDDGALAVTGGTDGELIVWDLNSGEIMRKIEGVESFEIGTPLISIALSSESDTALAGYENGIIGLWDIRTGEMLQQYREDEWNIESISFNPDGKSAILVTVNGELRQLDITEGTFSTLAHGPTALWPWISVSEDWSKAIVSADAFIQGAFGDDRLLLLDMQDGTSQLLSGGNETNVRAVDVNSDGSLGLSGDENGVVVLWDLKNAEVMSQIPQRGQGVRRVAFSPDGEKALISYFDGGLILWDINKEEVLQDFPIVLNVESVDFSPDGRTVYAANTNGALQLWDTQSGEEIDLLAGHTNIVWDLELSDDGRMAVSSSEDGDVRVWDLSNGANIGALDWPERQFTVTMSPNGRQALTGVGGDLLLWDLESGQVVKRLEGHEQTVFDIAFSPDGLRAVSSAGNIFENDPSSMIYWDLETGEELLRLDWETQLYTVSFTPDERFVVVSSNNTSEGPTLLIWDLSTGDVIDRLEADPVKLPMASSAASPDGQTVLTGYLDDPVNRDWVRLYDFHTGELLHSMVGHENSVIDIAYLPDSMRAVSASWDRSLILWDLENGVIDKRLAGQNVDLFSVAVDPKSRYALAGDGDGFILLWDLESGEVIRTYKGQSGPITQITVDPEGEMALSSAFDGTVLFWRIDADSDELIQWVMENRYVREVTCEERSLYNFDSPCE